MRTSLFLLFVCLCAISSASAAEGSRAEYIGGTRPEIRANDEGRLQVADKVYLIFRSRHTQVRIPYERINLLEYGQRVDRRYLAAVVISPLFMLAKKRQHFLTVGFQDDEGEQQAMVFKVNKDDIRLALVSLEARTGREVQYQDNEARMAGKG
ncbi:MAG: hypothetical protein JO270_04480 [Acidobacteriaceae bacterium]|nr:hypothetical protein [Acidobacteriaceae bacterium]MBV8570073.1 hypothetical protein [Acidobacteriaceae bacterium]